VQYIATLHDPPFAKRGYVTGSGRDEMRSSNHRELVSPANYKRLADLNLPIYLTTNYDDFLTRALKPPTAPLG